MREEEVGCDDAAGGDADEVRAGDPQGIHQAREIGVVRDRFLAAGGRADTTAGIRDRAKAFARERGLLVRPGFETAGVGMEEDHRHPVDGRVPNRRNWAPPTSTVPVLMGRCCAAVATPEEGDATWHTVSAATSNGKRRLRAFMRDYPAGSCQGRISARATGGP